jgi:hypothetical protein
MDCPAVRERSRPQASHKSEPKAPPTPVSKLKRWFKQLWQRQRISKNTVAASCESGGRKSAS